MHIKRFEAPTMAEALEQVKRELGPDALILSSRTLKQGRAAFGLLSRSRVEVQAAMERGSLASDRSAGSSSAEEGFAPASQAGEGLAELRRERANRERSEEFEDEIRAELRAMKNVLNGLVANRPGGESEPVAARLRSMGLDAGYAASLSAEWQASRAAGGLLEVERILRNRLEAKLAPPREDEMSLVRVLVGAPGVGKTTTLAKLAARGEEGERDVALISLDRYRIGGADQLRRYAELLDSPFAELSRAEDVGELVQRYAGRSILIDTAGRGPGGEEGMMSLLPLRDRLGDRARVELVLDATARPEVHAAQLNRFARLRPDRLIVAKADECDSLAPIANLALNPNCPSLCWIGTGQRVPEDLELVEADEIVANLTRSAA